MKTRIPVISLCALILLSIFLPAGQVVAQSNGQDAPITSIEQAQELYQQANDLYRQEEFAGARDIYLRIARSGYGSREVWSNAGNAAYRLGDTGQAVLYYKRALRQDPDYQQARQNLEAIQPATNMVEDEGLGGTITHFFPSTSPWIWIGAVEISFLALLISVFFLGKSFPRTESRSLWWSRTAGSMLFFVLASGTLIMHGLLRQTSADAVVLEDKVITRQGPGSEFFQQLELPAGTLVTFRSEPQNGWVRFKLLDGRSGYIRTDAVERI